MCPTCNKHYCETCNEHLSQCLCFPGKSASEKLTNQFKKSRLSKDSSRPSDKPIEDKKQL